MRASTPKKRSASPAPASNRPLGTPGRAGGGRRSLSPAPKNRGNAKVTQGMAGTPAATKKQEQYTAAAEASSPQNNPSDENAPAACRVTVAVRIKPTDGAKTLMRFGPRQENALRFTHVEEGKTRGGEEAKAFAYDHLFDQADSQADLYRALGSKVLQQVVSGQNASVFAYGQTGSGKTYTMLGTPEERGLIPRLCEGLFKEESIKDWNVTLSFFEIYNEQVVDLLNEPPETPTSEDDPPQERLNLAELNGKLDVMSRQEWLGVGLDPKRRVPVLNALRVRDHPKLGVFVEGLTKLPISSPADVEAALERGASLRAVAETAMNAESSRSHAVVQICCAEGEGGDRHATLNLIDLAGSENVNRSRSYEDHSRLQEAKSINKSLLGLGKCIQQLASDKGNNGVVPYRDSVLTWILKDALGGNAHTLMLCAVDPSPENGEQTLTTLRYADQAKRITTRPIENIDHTKRMVRELHEQVAALRAEADAASAAQAAAREQAAQAEAAAAAAAVAAAAAAEEREAAVAAAAAAQESQMAERAEVERWKEAAAAREEELRVQAEEAAKAAEEAKAEEARVAEENGRAAETKREHFQKAGATSDPGVMRAMAANGTAVAAAMNAPGTPGANGEGGGGMASIPEMDVAAVAKMSREEKRALAKKLKEERSALYVELGIEEKPPPPEPEVVKPPTLEPPPALFVHAFKCLGFVFTVNVESDPDSARSDAIEMEKVVEEEKPAAAAAAGGNKVRATPNGKREKIIRGVRVPA
jgi:hypothetical protein